MAECYEKNINNTSNILLLKFNLNTQMHCIKKYHTVVRLHIFTYNNFINFMKIISKIIVNIIFNLVTV